MSLIKMLGQARKRAGLRAMLQQAKRRKQSEVVDLGRVKFERAKAASGPGNWSAMTALYAGPTEQGWLGAWLDKYAKNADDAEVLLDGWDNAAEHGIRDLDEVARRLRFEPIRRQAGRRQTARQVGRQQSWVSPSYGEVRISVPRASGRTGKEWTNLSAEVDGKRLRFGWSQTQRRWSRSEVPPAGLISEAKARGWSFSGEAGKARSQVSRDYELELLRAATAAKAQYDKVHMLSGQTRKRLERIVEQSEIRAYEGALRQRLNTLRDAVTSWRRGELGPEDARRLLSAPRPPEPKKARRAPSAPKAIVNNAGFEVGDILYTSWGYDQTNVDFYRVVSFTAATITLQKIGKSVDSRQTGSNRVVPDGSSSSSKTTQHRTSTGKDTVKVGNHSAWKWDGRSVYQTASGWGH